MTGRADTWRFTWARTWGEVRAPAFLDRWERLRAAAPMSHVFHAPALVRAWAETCGAAIGAAPHVGHVTGPGGAELLLPWVVVTYPGRFVRRRVLEPAGRAFFGYHDPLAVGEVDWASFWEAAREAVGDACDAALFRLLPASFVRGPLADATAEESPILELGSARTLDDVLAGCSPNHRGDVRRRFRRLSEAGRVELWMPAAADAAVIADVRERFTPTLVANLAARFGVGDAGQGLAAFVERIVTEGLAEGWGSYAVLRVDGEPIAWHLGYRDTESLYWAFPTHAPAWDGHSSGKVLLARLIDWALGHGLRRLHLLTGAQPYKLAWKPSRPRLGVIRWYAPSMRGHLLAQYDRAHGTGGIAVGSR